MKIAVIGAGYVGLVTASCFSEFGYNVICIDSNKDKIGKLKKNIIPIYEPGLSDLVKKNTNAKHLVFSNNVSDIKSAQVIFIAVGTPSSRRGDGEADLKYVFKVCKDISKLLTKKQKKIIITKSTVPVGTGNRLIDIIKKLRPDLLYDEDYFIASNPEFLREGSAIEDFMRPDRVVCGVTNRVSKEILENLYRPLNLREAPLLFTDLESAEMIKYASNAFLALKISFINEMANLCEKAGGNVQMVAKGMGLDNRIGSKFLHPGPGFGGSCFPKDTRALYSSFKKYRVKNTLVKSVIDFNEKRKFMMVNKIKKLLNSKVKNKKIAFLGVTFKPNTDDLRESPSLVIIPQLIKLGAIIKAHDPAYNKSFLKLKEFNKVKWFNDVFAAIKDSDLLVIHTEWNEYRGLDLKKIKETIKNPIILDLRNIFNKNDINKINIKYYGIGFVS
ncbi:MAG: UDP-glucose 6-dehydrogenase [Rickettsiales bacterium]|nr:UDP-glucose 6-dehydrogenase [Rickettsiales bacterium]OUV80291.1 MAG: UDP-glucose 6-dehydrogenase [Rickettsiales bacterium TMED131]